MDHRSIRVGRLHPEHYEHRAPGMGVVSAGVESAEVWECQTCGALTTRSMVEAHASRHVAEDAQ